MQEDFTIPRMVEQVRSGKMSRRQLMKSLTTMGISTAGAGVVVAAAVGPSTMKAPQVVDTLEDGKMHIRLHDQHLSYQTQGNKDALHADYAEHAVLEDSLFPVPISGRAAIIARKSLGLAAATDAQINVLNRIVSGNQVTVEWLATGLHTGDLPGLPATGRAYTLRGVTVVIREEGKIVRESLYYDANDLYRQLNT